MLKTDDILKPLSLDFHNIPSMFVLFWKICLCMDKELEVCMFVIMYTVLLKIPLDNTCILLLISQDVLFYNLLDGDLGDVV